MMTKRRRALRAVLPLGYDCQPCSQSSKSPGEKVFLPIQLHKPRDIFSVWTHQPRSKGPCEKQCPILEGGKEDLGSGGSCPPERAQGKGEGKKSRGSEKSQIVDAVK